MPDPPQVVCAAYSSRQVENMRAPTIGVWEYELTKTWSRMIKALVNLESSMAVSADRLRIQDTFDSAAQRRSQAGTRQTLGLNGSA
jgi:hypothetical protein